MEIALPRSTWKNLVAALVNPEPSPVTGTVTENEIVWLLAELGGLYPEPPEIAAEDLQIS